MNPLKKLDWNVTDEPDLIWISLALFGGQLTLEAWGKLPLLPPPAVGGTDYSQTNVWLHTTSW